MHSQHILYLKSSVGLLIIKLELLTIIAIKLENVTVVSPCLCQLTITDRARLKLVQPVVCSVLVTAGTSSVLPRVREDQLHLGS